MLVVNIGGVGISLPPLLLGVRGSVLRLGFVIFFGEANAAQFCVGRVCPLTHHALPRRERLGGRFDRTDVGRLGLLVSIDIYIIVIVIFIGIFIGIVVVPPPGPRIVPLYSAGLLRERRSWSWSWHCSCRWGWSRR